MSVDYTANYGIGYKVKPSGGIPKYKIEGGLGEYLHDQISDGFEYFEVGCGAYNGDEDDTYVVVSDPLKDGLDLSKAKGLLDNEIVRLRLLADGDFGIVGGLLVW